MTDNHNPKRDCPYCNKSIITSRLGKHFLNSCKTAFVEANKKKFTSEFNGYMSCRLKNEELIYISLATQSSCMKEKMIWPVARKEVNIQKHKAVAKQLLQELSDLKSQDKPIDDINTPDLDTKEIQDNSEAFLTAIASAKNQIDKNEDHITELERIIEALKKRYSVSEEDYEDVESECKLDEDDMSDINVQSLFKDKAFLKKHTEITNDYVRKFRK